jgi:hypothetical protein
MFLPFLIQTDNFSAWPPLIHRYGFTVTLINTLMLKQPIVFKLKDEDLPFSGPEVDPAVEPPPMFVISSLR